MFRSVLPGLAHDTPGLTITYSLAIGARLACNLADLVGILPVWTRLARAAVCWSQSSVLLTIVSIENIQMLNSIPPGGQYEVAQSEGALD